MHLVVVHTEHLYFGGAEKMLAPFLGAVSTAGLTVSLACTPNQYRDLPPDAKIVDLPVNQPFRFQRFAGQVKAVMRHAKQSGASVIHGWSARDWELTALVGRLAGVPATGTLHDHPAAAYVSRPRRRLMQTCAKYGLQRIVCVSDAVAEACRSENYPPAKLITIHNGIPFVDSAPRFTERSPTLIFGFLGAISQVKGLDTLLAATASLAARADRDWELRIAGDGQDDESRQWLADLQNRYRECSWWPRVKWLGWIDNPSAFLQEIDVLVCPSTGFDSFPTVLLEAAHAAIPVIASRIGGVPEIVRHGVTGWLFEPGNVAEVTALLDLCFVQSRLAEAGEAARRIARSDFSVAAMGEAYRAAFAAICR